MPALAQLKDLFKDFGGKLPQHELEMLLEAAFHQEFPLRERLNRRQLYSGEELPQGQWLTQARIWAEKRLLARVPLQHLTRDQCFFGRYFEVGPEVLIPRPETEVLVDRAITSLRPLCRTGECRGVEIGAGSGAISITLALELGETLHMVSTEVSEESWERARANASKFDLNTERVDWMKLSDPDDVMTSLRDQVQILGRPFDFLITNPPYLLDSSLEVDEEVAMSEPRLALFAPEGDPLFYYREIAEHARAVLKPGGWVFLEIPHERAEEIRSLFESDFEQIQILPDLAGRSRVLEAKLTVWTK